MFSFSILLIPPSAMAEPIYQFEVPVILKNMPSEVKYMRLKWFIMDKGLSPQATGEVPIPVEQDANGNFSKVVTITIDEKEIKDYSKAETFVVKFELSKDGFSFYPPNTSGQPWTKSKPGTNLVKFMASDKLS